MSIFDFLLLVGGLALFLYGMNMMGDGLKRISGGRLEEILERLTSTPVKGVLLGAAVTAIIQSSSATTVMVVGFVNSGIMQLEQTVGVIMGANIGTTVTSWLLSLTGIHGDNVWVKLLEPSSFSPVLAMIGVILVVFTKDEKKKDIGTILVGFAVIMFGMERMSESVEPLADMPEFRSLMIRFANPFYGMFAGAVLTAVIQSSSASVGILQALCATGAVPYSVAIPIIMGQNIGTCITAVIASIGASKNSKRTACIHLSFNVIGTFVFMAVFYTLNQFLHFEFLPQAATEVGIAVVHSAFNISATLVLLPCSGMLVAIARVLLPDNDQEEQSHDMLKLLEPRFLEKPGYAIAQAKKVSEYVIRENNKMFEEARQLIFKYDKEKLGYLEKEEQLLEEYYPQLSQYLMKISARDVSESDGYILDVLLQSIGDFERISKHTLEIARKSKELKNQKKELSKQAQEELLAVFDEMKKLLQMTERVLDDTSIGKALLKQTEKVQEMLSKCKKGHTKRLRKGKCSAEMGIRYMDVLFHCGSIAEHCANIMKSFAA